jgi:hypothetical protein
MAVLQTYKGGYYLWNYVPSMPAAVVFIVLFVIMSVLHSWRIFKTGTKFCWPFAIGCICKSPVLIPDRKSSNDRDSGSHRLLRQGSFSQYNWRIATLCPSELLHPHRACSIRGLYLHDPRPYCAMCQRGASLTCPDYMGHKSFCHWGCSFVPGTGKRCRIDVQACHAKNWPNHRHLRPLHPGHFVWPLLPHGRHLPNLHE